MLSSEAGDAVWFGQGRADRLALREQKGVGHAAADDQHIHLVEQTIDDLDLVGDLGPADDRDERALGVVQQLAERADLAVDEIAGVGGPQARHPFR